MEIVVDKDVCQGLGMCEAMAPEVFEVGEDGYVHVLDAAPAEEHRKHLRAAVAACPVSALRLHG